MSLKQIVIVGATAPEIVKLIEAVNERASSYEIVGFLDDDKVKHGQMFFDHKILGGTDLLTKGLRGCSVVNNVAKTSGIRMKVFQKLRDLGVNNFPSIVHPSVDLRYTEIGEATVIHEGCVLGPGVRVGPNCLVSFRAIVAHESTVAASVIISPGAVVNGRVRIEEGAFLGAGCVILPCNAVGAWSIIGAGSTVIEDVAAHSTVFGMPARAIEMRRAMAAK
jgi:sugar O-acyltransferase (sialic acid O-acetyltransferase NeuD family)